MLVRGGGFHSNGSNLFLTQLALTILQASALFLCFGYKLDEGESLFCVFAVVVARLVSSGLEAILDVNLNVMEVQLKHEAKLMGAI